MAGDATTTKDYATDAEVQSVLAFAELYRCGREGVAEAYLSTLLRLAPKLAREVRDARAALGLPDGADVAERVARLQEQVRLRESELLRCRTAENHAAATLDTIRAELRLPVGCPGVDILNAVIALKGDSRSWAQAMCEAQSCVTTFPEAKPSPPFCVGGCGQVVMGGTICTECAKRYAAMPPPPPPPVEVGAGDEGEVG